MIRQNLRELLELLENNQTKPNHVQVTMVALVALVALVAQSERDTFTWIFFLNALVALVAMVAFGCQWNFHQNGNCFDCYILQCLKCLDDTLGGSWGSALITAARLISIFFFSAWSADLQLISLIAPRSRLSRQVWDHHTHNRALVIMQPSVKSCGGRPSTTKLDDFVMNGAAGCRRGWG